MFKYLKITVISGFIMCIGSGFVLSQEHAHKHAEAITAATPKLAKDEAVITGKVICLGCTLKKEKQARVQCSIYGHVNALLIEKIYDRQGKSLKEAKEKIYQFLHNDRADKLIKDHAYAGKIIVITGKIYPEANILEVTFFKQKGGRK
jgi:hypothetical protein